MTKLWQKNITVDNKIEKFTVGRDREMDLYLAPFDVQGSIAHITMLQSIGLLEKDELNVLTAELKNIYAKIIEGQFVIEEGIEDVHSQVEVMLTDALGDIGKKIHSGRSRNDQVLIDLKLFIRDALRHLSDHVVQLFTVYQQKSEAFKEVLLPGYTHFQVAMPSSFGLWLGAYAESLVDDMKLVRASFEVANKNPLGSAAGYGSSFPLNRQMTTDLLGFESLNYNVVYAQMGRGKTEKTVSFALASLAETIGRFAMDACLYLSQNFGFISFPAQYTTGSSIMPHKKNPDVFEVIRAKCNQIKSLPNEISMITTNLPSGYHRDLQLIKESFIPAFETMHDCIDMTIMMLENMEVNSGILEDPKYQYLFSVEEVNRMVLDGVPFRDAYKTVGINIEQGNFNPDKNVKHTHEGSIGNLCTTEIKSLMDAEINSLIKSYEVIDKAILKLIE